MEELLSLDRLLSGKFKDLTLTFGHRRETFH